MPSVRWGDLFMGRIKYFLIRIKNPKKISWVIIIILLLSFNTYRRSPYTYKKEHRPLNYALKGGKLYNEMKE